MFQITHVNKNICTFAPELNVAQKHKDPSDHVIISQAITMRIPLISSDSKFDFYRRQGLELIYNE